jgi:hypothetical protein
MEFIIFGTLWFWVFLAGLTGLIIYALESALYGSKDNGGGIWATVLIVGGFVAYYYLGSKQDVVNILTYVKDHPLHIILGFLGYVVVGLVWAFFKWYFFVSSKLAYHEERKKDYNGKHHTFTVPTARDNKYRIMSWMYYWPFSAFWTLSTKPFKRAFDYVYEKTGGMFDKIAAKMFSNLVKKDEADKAEIEAERAKNEAERLERNKRKPLLND